MRESASDHNNPTPTRLRAGRSTIAALLAAAASLATLSLPAIVRADDQDVIDYREHIMKTLGAQLNAVELIVQNKAPADAASNFVAHVKILALAASTAKSAFQPNVRGGEAKPNIWSDWSDFSKRMDQLAANMSDLEKTAESGGVAATEAKLQTALTCKGCHDQYREQKKK